MAEATARLMPPDSHLVERAGTFEHEALDRLFERTFESVYGLVFGLSGVHQTAQRLAVDVYSRLLEGISGFEGDAAAADRWALRLAAESRLEGPGAPVVGLRNALVRLGGLERAVIALRLLVGLSSDSVAVTLGRRPAFVQSALLGGLRRVADGRSGPDLARGGGRELDRTIDRLVAGEQVELTPTLQAAAGILALPKEPAPAGLREQVRGGFLAAAEERRALWVHRHHVPAEVPWARPRKSAVNLGETSVLMLIGALALGVGVMLAVLASFSDPASPFGLYPLKRAGESTLVLLNRDPVKRADLDLKLAQNRRKEAESMAASGHPDLATAAVRAHFVSLRATADQLIRTPNQAAAWIKVRDQFETEASASFSVVETQLSSQGFKAQAAEVKDANQAFQDERRQLDPRLGKPLVPGALAAPGATPPPASPGQ